MIDLNYEQLLADKIVCSVIATGHNPQWIYGRIEMMVKPVDKSIWFNLYIEDNTEPYLFPSLQEALKTFEGINKEYNE